MAETQTEPIAELVTEIRSLRLVIQYESQVRRKYDQPLTREQAAEYLGVHKDTLYGWAVEEGRIAYSRLGDGTKASLRFIKKDLDEFVDHHRVPAVEETRARKS
ncbi:MAG TPA: helix-turn-helix domain-containing protein [Candidatus Hydrogenedentes bacterium]|nr:helix-turn-helix domain-containing protein [Candidatus Hydrogenedentota bacterium]